MTNHDTPVARWRARMGLSQRAAAASLGMTLSGYPRAEAGINTATGEPRPDDLRMRLACAAVEHGIPPIE